MAKKRFYGANGYSRGESPNGPSVSSMNHTGDKFNDEHRTDKDTPDASMGFDTRRAVRANANEFYAGMDARRRLELEDAGMIHEDPRAIANLPQEVMIKAYPKTGPYLPEGLNDRLEGIDKQMDYDDEQRQRHFYAKKV